LNHNLKNLRDFFRITDEKGFKDCTDARYTKPLPARLKRLDDIATKIEGGLEGAI